MIEVKQLEFNYPKQQKLAFPDFTCNASEVLLITGNSGVGKTTLLHLLAGLLQPSKGGVVINGTKISDLQASAMDTFRGKEIGVVLQQNYFIDALTVLENLQMATYVSTKKNNTIHINSLLNDLGLQDLVNKYPSTLSVGQQQRVSIARALINNPKVILADEPTSSLDDMNALLVADLLERIAKNYNTALVIVTHDTRLKQRFNKQLHLL